MPATDNTNSLEQHFRHVFEANVGMTLNGNNAALKQLRQNAIEAFSEAGLPTRKTEAYKYTPIERALSAELNVSIDPASNQVTADHVQANLIPNLDAFLVVTLNGRLVVEQSKLDGLPAGLTFSSLSEALVEQTDFVNQHLGRYAKLSAAPFTALNTAFVKDGLFLHVPVNTRVEKPIYILHLLSGSDDQLLQPRMLYIAEAGAEVTVIENWKRIDEGQTFINSLTEWAVAANAHADHYQLQQLGGKDTLVAGVEGYQSGTSTFSLTTVTLSGGMIRNNFNLLPDAEDCTSHLYGLVLADGNMHVDNHTLVDHAKPNCYSNELYKHILGDEATGIFNGKVFVRPDAQKINAYQSNKSITLTDKAKMYSKPELEIYADDVRCSHGATTGQLDSEALFYLRSRGLSKDQARSMLLQAFALDVIEPIKVEALRAYLDNRIAEKI